MVKLGKFVFYSKVQDIRRQIYFVMLHQIYMENFSTKHFFEFGEKFRAKNEFYLLFLHSAQCWPTKQNKVSHWLTFFQHQIVMMCLYHTVIAYRPWKCDFAAANFTHKEKVNYIQVLSCLAAHSQTILFALNITIVSQHQNVWKVRLMRHLKLNFPWVYRGRESLYFCPDRPPFCKSFGN